MSHFVGLTERTNTLGGGWTLYTCNDPRDQFVDYCWAAIDSTLIGHSLECYERFVSRCVAVKEFSASAPENYFRIWLPSSRDGYEKYDASFFKAYEHERTLLIATESRHFSVSKYDWDFDTEINFWSTNLLCFTMMRHNRCWRWNKRHETIMQGY